MKDQAATTAPTPAPTENTVTTRSFGQKMTTPLSASNKFAPLSDDFNTAKPIINTSRPAKEAPKLAPMTLASATSNGAAPMVASGGSGGGPKKSFASKFAEQVKIANDPNYKPPPKPVNFESEDDFPSLGAPAKKPANTVAVPSPGSVASIPKSSSGQSFAELAKGWAKKKEDEAEEERQKAIREEQRRRENAVLSKGAMLMRFGRNRHADYDDEDEDDYDPSYGDDNLLDDDSYEAPSHDEAEDEDSEEDQEQQDGEFNNTMGYDRRHRNDLY